MKAFKKILFVGAIALVIAAASVTALAATGFSNSADIIAGLTGQSADRIIAEKTETGKTYGEIADDAGVLEEFKTQMLESKKEILAEKVAQGIITQEQADAIIERMEANMADCDGTGSGGVGSCGTGAGLGMMGGQGRGNGGMGQGRGAGMCAGQAG
jgi:hypothetical protein